MLVATFGPSTAWVGKKITHEGNVFVLEDHGVITAADVMTYDMEGHLVWSNESMRGWVAAWAPAPAPVTQRTAPRPQEVSQPKASSRNATLVATFGPSTAWVGKTITYEDGRFILEGYGAISAGGVLTYDQQGHLEWAYVGLREWVTEQAREKTTAGALMGVAVGRSSVSGARTNLNPAVSRGAGTQPQSRPAGPLMGTAVGRSSVSRSRANPNPAVSRGAGTQPQSRKRPGIFTRLFVYMVLGCLALGIIITLVTLLWPITALLLLSFFVVAFISTAHDVFRK